MTPNTPFFPPSATAHAGEVDALFFFFLALACFFTIVVFSLVAVFAIKYRRRHADQMGIEPKSHGTLLEITWSVIPFVLMMFAATWALKIYIQAMDVPSNAKPFYVVGKQWMWKIEHPDGRREINELHVPKGENIKLVMTSEDVIHSFFIRHSG